MRDFDKDFESWLVNDFAEREIDTPYSFIMNFDKLPFSMQWGVYQDFFDKKGVKIFERFNETSGKIGFEIWEKVKGSYKMKKTTPMLITEYTRQEARQSSINKAKEIYSKNQ